MVNPVRGAERRGTLVTGIENPVVGAALGKESFSTTLGTQSSVEVMFTGGVLAGE